MAGKNQDTPIGILDVRLIEKYLHEGRIDGKELQGILSKLPDDEKNAQYIEVFEEPAAEEETPKPSKPDGLTFT